MQTFSHLTDSDQNDQSDESIRSLESVDIPMNIPKKSFDLPFFASIIFCTVYMLPILPLYPTAHSCLAIVCTVCFLWITEAIPPFATSYLIPILSVWLQIGIDNDTGQRIPASTMAQIFSYKFMDPIIFVFFGSLVLSTGLQKLNITNRVSRFILSLITPKPSIVLLVLMLINLFIGAFLSNVASTTLTLSLAIPIIKTLHPTDPFIKALLFGIAWSGNCGGQPTTIASPQNVIAAHVVNEFGSNVSFLSWVTFGTPVSIILTILQWFYLITIFPKSSNARLQISTIGNEEPWSVKHTEAVIVTFITIFLWSFGDKLSWFMGHIGIASLIPIVTFFGSGILTTSDFNSLKWSTLSLLGGGLALGESMKLSGLLDVIADGAKEILKNVSILCLLIVILMAESIVASILSSTTAASIIFPLIMAISSNTGHAPLLVVLAALMISTSQLFHISSFPNALVSGVAFEGTIDEEREIGIASGTTYLKGSEYFRYGWPTIVMGWIVISTVGYTAASKLGL